MFVTGVRLPCYPDDFLKMFLLLDCVQHECGHGFAGEGETHLRSGIFTASIGQIIFLSENSFNLSLSDLVFF
ncbi:MAG: hypothetical protein DMF20_06110 [Verrucomicrobia bacterium]|nr:MAG: hypothetical protein DMF20_06110 [Verrucomicrobiota bacterium]